MSACLCLLTRPVTSLPSPVVSSLTAAVVEQPALSNVVRRHSNMEEIFFIILQIFISISVVAGI